MFRQKYFYVILIVMMFFVIASGGCGGGSNNSSSQSNPNNPSPNNPSPDNPNPNNPETEYDISVLTGTWKASTGTCTFTDPTGTFTLVPGDEGINFSFSDIQQVNDDSANIVMEADIHWKGGTNISGRFSRNSRTFHHIGVNVWRWVVNDPDADDTITITITSPTTLEVEESSTNAEQHQIYSARYTLVKQSATTPNINDINGTWCITGGTLTYLSEDGQTYRDYFDYVQGSSSPEQFTLTISDTGKGDYVINVSGAGVFNKEGSPYIKAAFTGNLRCVARVVWGTSDDWEYFGGEEYGGPSSTYKRTDTDIYTYSAEFPSAIHDVSEASFRLLQSSRIRYKQTGLSVESVEKIEKYPEADPNAFPGLEGVTIELTLERVN